MPLSAANERSTMRKITVLAVIAVLIGISIGTVAQAGSHER
jgi:hypothetical protein